MVYLLLVSFIWGFSFVLIKGTLVSLDSNFVSFARLLLSFIAFVPFIRLAGIRLSDKLQLMLIGGVQFGLMYVAYVAAYQYLPAHVVALMTTTTPLLVTFFNDVCAGRIHKAFFLAALLAAAGGAIIQLPDQPPIASIYGIMLVQFSNAAFAFGQIAYKRLMDSRKNLKDKSVFGLMYGGAIVAAGAFSMATTDFRALSIQTHQWLALLYLGIIASGICFFLWNLGARRVNEGILAVMNNLKIPIAVVASLVILGEKTNYFRLVAGCVLLAIALRMNGKVRSQTTLRDSEPGGAL